MTNLRYLSSFAIASILYAIGIFSVIWLWDTKAPTPKINEEVIKIALIAPPKPIIQAKPTPPTPPKPKIPEPPKPKKIIKKPKPKKVVKKVISRTKSKPKKVIKKVTPKPKKVIKKPKHKKVVKKVISTPKPKPQPKAVVREVASEPIIKAETKAVEMTPSSPPTQPKINLDAKKRMFLRSVRNSIYANKKYPPIAKRRNIQGRVKVTFDIDQNGQISNIRTNGGSKILQKAARKSVLKSAPLTVPSALYGQFPMQNVSINIDFKLQ